MTRNQYEHPILLSREDVYRSDNRADVKQLPAILMSQGSGLAVSDSSATGQCCRKVHVLQELLRNPNYLHFQRSFCGPERLQGVRGGCPNAYICYQCCCQAKRGQLAPACWPLPIVLRTVHAKGLSSFSILVIADRLLLSLSIGPLKVARAYSLQAVHQG